MIYLIDVLVGDCWTEQHDPPWVPLRKYQHWREGDDCFRSHRKMNKTREKLQAMRNARAKTIDKECKKFQDVKKKRGRKVKKHKRKSARGWERGQVQGRRWESVRSKEKKEREKETGREKLESFAERHTYSALSLTIQLELLLCSLHPRSESCSYNWFFEVLENPLIVSYLGIPSAYLPKIQAEKVQVSR